MKNKSIALITSSGGHGFMELNFGKLHNQEIVAFSEKYNKEDFEKEVKDIYERLSPFVPDMKVATWDNAQELQKRGISWRKVLLDKKLNQNDWDMFAQTSLSPKHPKQLPEFKNLQSASDVVMLIPQKLFSDGKCGLSASQQTVPLEVFNFFKSEEGIQYLLGQHFHKVNDVEHVKNIAKDFNMYIPGEKEDTNVFGIRGVPHDQYLNMYKKVDMSVGIAGTHTWYMLTCFPDKPQIIFYNKNGVEHWEEIAKAYQKQGKPIYTMGFDENTDWKRFSLEAKALYTKLSKSIQKEKIKSQQLASVLKETQDKLR